MNLELKDAGTARKIAIVTFDAEEIQNKENEACIEIGKIASIPGFRKGKAPTAVIRKKYSKELKDELTRKVSTDAYESILDNKEIKVVPEMLNLLGCSKNNFKRLLIKMDYKVYEKEKEYFIKYLPIKRKISKKDDKKDYSNNPFSVLNQLNLK